MVGLVIAGIAGMTIFIFKKNYPGVSIYKSEPDSLQALRIICLAVAIPILLGILGFFTARGLARLRPPGAQIGNLVEHRCAGGRERS